MSGDDKPPLFRWRDDVMSSDMRPALKHLALTMATYMDVAGRDCYPSAATLAKKTSMNVGTVHRLRMELEELGWIMCVVRGGSFQGERRQRSLFQIPRRYTEPRAQHAGSA